MIKFCRAAETSCAINLCSPDVRKHDCYRTQHMEHDDFKSLSLIKLFRFPQVITHITISKSVDILEIYLDHLLQPNRNYLLYITSRIRVKQCQKASQLVLKKKKRAKVVELKEALLSCQTDAFHF